MTILSCAQLLNATSDSSQVSLRRQEIADRLNAWTIFNGKNKEFCDWLTQMENKVCHSGDLSIEEMVEKLKKVHKLMSCNFFLDIHMEEQAFLNIFKVQTESLLCQRPL